MQSQFQHSAGEAKASLLTCKSAINRALNNLLGQAVYSTTVVRLTTLAFSLHLCIFKERTISVAYSLRYSLT